MVRDSLALLGLGRNNPDAPYYDRLVAQSVLDDLLSALGK
jgi:hypothetical protein